MSDENKKEGQPTPTSEENQEETVVTPVEEATPDFAEDANFEKELKALEDADEAPAPAPRKTELEKAEYSLKSTAKRIKDLGGNPASLLDVDEPEPAPAESPVDTSKFVTKLDLVRADAAKLARSPSELKLMMWYVEHRNMSLDDAHLLANKGKFKKTIAEVTRTRETVPANPSGGAGGAPAITRAAPQLSPEEHRQLLASGMVYDPTKKAYIGKKVQHRYDEAKKEWVNERLS